MHIRGFYLTGKLFDTDGIQQCRFATDAVAIEKTWGCKLAFDNWEMLIEDHPDLQSQLIAELGWVIAHKEREVLSTHHYLLCQRWMSCLFICLSFNFSRIEPACNEISKRGSSTHKF